MAKRSESQVKDALLEHVSQDIKKLQSLQCDVSLHEDTITSNNTRAQALCYHLDCILWHGLHRADSGYWECMIQLSHKDTVRQINELSQVRTSNGKGHSWLNLALNEQVMESYLRTFMDNQSIISHFYNQSAFLRDKTRLSVLVTLISGLDFVTFDLDLDEEYLNYRITPNDSYGERNLDLNIDLSFLSRVTPEIQRKQQSFTSSETYISSAHTTTHQKEPQMTSSLPSSFVILSQVNGEEVGGANVSEPRPPQTQPVTSSPVKEHPIDEAVGGATAAVGGITASHDSHVTASSGGPSFLNRYIQLDQQERDQIEKKKEEEEFIVSRAHKKTKKKKKKKKKETEEEPEIEATPTSDTPIEVPSIQESQSPPTQSDPVSLSEPIEPVKPVGQSSLYEELLAADGNLLINENEDYFTEDNKMQSDAPMVSHDSPMMSRDGHVTDVKSRNRSGAILSSNPFEDFDTEATPTETTPSDDIPTSYAENFSKIPQKAATLSLPPLNLDDSIKYDAPPTRPKVITEENKRECDVAVDENTKLVLTLEIFNHPQETLIRLVQVRVPVGPGRYQTAYLTVTNEAVYLIERDGTAGSYSRVMGVVYSNLEYLVIGLSWQSLGLVYMVGGRQEKQMVITGNEAVAKSIANTIRITSSVPLNRDDESRTEAIERELIKLGSETSMELVRYCLVHWEQLSGETPLFSPPADIGVPFSGSLEVKEIGLLKSSWRMCYFTLIEGTLFQFNNEADKTPRATYPLQGSRGGCTRTKGDAKDFAFTVWDSSGDSLLLAARDEEELSKWMQALCLAAAGQTVDLTKSYNTTVQKGGGFCAVLHTLNKIHVLHEDWSNESVHLMTSISVEDINNVGVDSQLPIYCTLSYDNDHSPQPSVWMLCFSSEYELGKFEETLSERYNDIFQIDPQFSEIKDEAVKKRAEQALELMRASKQRSDSLTKGRTDYHFD